MNSKTNQALSITLLARSKREYFADLLARCIPIGTRVSWTTTRGDRTWRHHGEVISSPIAHDLSFNVRNEKTGKTRSMHASDCYGFEVEDA